MSCGLLTVNTLAHYVVIAGPMSATQFAQSPSRIGDVGLGSTLNMVS